MCFAASSQNVIAQALICKQVEDDDVCQGVIGQQGPVLAQILRNISPFDDTSTKLCNALLGLCQPPDVVSYKVPFPKPAPTNPKTWVSRGNSPFQVAHFSDVHIDRQYTVSALSNGAYITWGTNALRLSGGIGSQLHQAHLLQKLWGRDNCERPSSARRQSQLRHSTILGPFDASVPSEYQVLSFHWRCG